MPPTAAPRQASLSVHRRRPGHRRDERPGPRRAQRRHDRRRGHQQHDRHGHRPRAERRQTASIARQRPDASQSISSNGAANGILPRQHRKRQRQARRHRQRRHVHLRGELHGRRDPELDGRGDLAERRARRREPDPDGGHGRRRRRHPRDDRRRPRSGRQRRDEQRQQPCRGAEERGLDYFNVSGTPQILRTTVSGSDDTNAHIQNTGGTTHPDVDGSTFSGSKFNAGLRLRGEGTVGDERDRRQQLLQAERRSGLLDAGPTRRNPRSRRCCSTTTSFRAAVPTRCRVARRSRSAPTAGQRSRRR